MNKLKRDKLIIGEKPLQKKEENKMDKQSHSIKEKNIKNRRKSAIQNNNNFLIQISTMLHVKLQWKQSTKKNTVSFN